MMLLNVKDLEYMQEVLQKTFCRFPWCGGFTQAGSWAWPQPVSPLPQRERGKNMVKKAQGLR